MLFSQDEVQATVPDMDKIMGGKHSSVLFLSSATHCPVQPLLQPSWSGAPKSISRQTIEEGSNI
jgi:hypothetical protein